MPRGPEVIAGLRPEDIGVVAQRAEGDIEVSVVVTEPAGSALWVETQWKDRTLRCMARPDDEIKAGDRVYLRFSVEDVVVFEAATGTRL